MIHLLISLLLEIYFTVSAGPVLNAISYVILPTSWYSFARNFTGVHVSQIQKWKSLLQKEGSRLFEDRRLKESQTQEKIISKLHEKIGQLTVERDFLGRVLDH